MDELQVLARRVEHLESVISRLTALYMPTAPAGYSTPSAARLIAMAEIDPKAAIDEARRLTQVENLAAAEERRLRRQQNKKSTKTGAYASL